MPEKVPESMLFHTCLPQLFAAHQHLPDRKSQEGASSVEYGLLAAGIAGLLVAVVFLFGETVLELFASTCDEINKELADACVEE